MNNQARPLLKKALEDGNLDAVVDPKLQDYDFNEMTQMICCAAACVRHLGRFRPRMSQIVRALEGNMPLDELNEGITSGFSMVYSSGSSDYNTRQYVDDLKKFRKLALESPEHDNSTVNPLASTSSQECSEPTSESAELKFHGLSSLASWVHFSQQVLIGDVAGCLYGIGVIPWECNCQMG
ncbi:PROLINE-RICH RECEPTOR-LIKE PROTEIN KINASE PERK4 [Salix koriyanagi]|uniref:non-specific serine/threonine protein kinase n=1 Tax=Salix koriyanagi TaxID=2511006 RepID=A0A9Q0T547_9ROSI|nr:PROLINE-RICH RECEPTOR-LIKE PROTEIN KINASE PERK4 [Salix koriyanagi]